MHLLCRNRDLRGFAGSHILETSWVWQRSTVSVTRTECKCSVITSIYDWNYDRRWRIYYAEIEIWEALWDWLLLTRLCFRAAMPLTCNWAASEPPPPSSQKAPLTPTWIAIWWHFCNCTWCTGCTSSKLAIDSQPLHDSQPSSWVFLKETVVVQMSGVVYLLWLWAQTIIHV